MSTGVLLGRSADDGDLGWGADLSGGGAGEDVERLLRERPPHWG